MNKLSTKLLLLVFTPVAVLVILSIAVTLRGNKQIINLQAKKMAQTVANQVITDRAHYVKRVVKKVKGSEFAAKEGFTDESPHVPLPATFVMGVAEDVSSSQDEYKYKLVSRWNINPGNALSDDFLKRGFADLIEQEKQAKAQGQLSPSKPFKNWQPFTEVMEVNGKPTLRFLTADPAAGAACVSCHNALEGRDDIMALRRKDGIETGYQFELNDLMGAVAVDVNLEEAGAIAAATATKTLIWMIAAGTVSLLATVWYVRKGITRPLRGFVDRLNRVGEGQTDLSDRTLTNRKDEIGEASRSVDKFINYLRGIMSEVGKAGDDVAEAARQIATYSEEMSVGMTKQSEQTSQIASTTEEMSASITEVARKSMEAAHSADESGKNAAEGGQVVEQTIQSMRSINDAVTSGAATVSELGERSQQIGQIIDVINDIADQTNLLALNAAIEAARAGEHGRGFAVVADEVRKLADRTTKATDEIAGSIKAIQEETNQAVAQMNDGTQQVETGVARAAEADANLKKIVTSAQEVASMVQSIAAAAEQQSAASGAVSRSVTSIAEVTNQTSERVGHIASAAEGLSTSTQSLMSIVGNFNIERRGQDVGPPPGMAERRKDRATG